MAPRPQWKGYLKLSLVSCPISLYPAVSAAEKVAFRQVNRETGNRLRQQLVDSVTGEVVETPKKGRGYEVGENQFLVIPDEELVAAQQEARTRPFSAPPAPTVAPATPASSAPTKRGPTLKLVEPEPPRAKEKVAPPEQPAAPVQPPAPPPRPILENTRTIELDRFFSRDELDPRYYSTPYYIAPRDDVGLEAFAVIRDAMARLGLVGMGRVVLANRERPILIEPMGSGLRGTTLRYAHEVRSEAEYFADIPPLELPQDVVQMTEYILNSKREPFSPAYLEDRYRTVLVEKLREKRAQAPARTPSTTPSPRNVINLMEALKRSLPDQKPPAPSRPRKTPATKQAGATSAKAPAKSVKKPRTH